MSPLFPWPGTATGNETQTYETTLPLLALGSGDYAVLWPLPFADAAYRVTYGIEGGTAVLGKAEAKLKDGTRTTTGCTITVTNTGLVTIAAGAKLHVIAVGPLPS